MKSITSNRSSELSSISPSKAIHKTEEEQNGRPAMMVDGAMRWITDDGTPGDIVSNGNFYFNEFHDGTFRLFDKDSRNERTEEFSRSTSFRCDHLRKDSMISPH